MYLKLVTFNFIFKTSVILNVNQKRKIVNIVNVKKEKNALYDKYIIYSKYCLKMMFLIFTNFPTNSVINCKML